MLSFDVWSKYFWDFLDNSKVGMRRKTGCKTSAGLDMTSRITPLRYMFL